MGTPNADTKSTTTKQPQIPLRQKHDPAPNTRKRKNDPTVILVDFPPTTYLQFWRFISIFIKFWLDFTCKFYFLFVLKKIQLSERLGNALIAPLKVVTTTYGHNYIDTYHINLENDLKTRNEVGDSK